MKFACPKCNTRYSIADSKVPSGKTLRFTCKKCEHSFRLKRKGGATPEPAGPADALGGMPEGAEATRVANLDEIMDLKRRSKTGGNPVKAPATSTPFEEAEWFVLVAGKQKGPFGQSRVEAMLRNEEINGRTYAWRDGMADWKRLAGVAEFAALVDELGGGDARLRPKTQPLPPTPSASGAPRQPPPSAAESIDEPSVFEQATTSMSADQLRAELAKLDAQQAAGDALSASALVPESTLPQEAEAPADVPLFGSMDHPDPPSLLGPGGGPQSNPDYLHGAPGEATRVFMATAGIYKRRRNQKLAAALGGVFVVSLATIITLDLTGVYTIPGMGLVYDYTGFEDPNAARAVARTEAKLQEEDLSLEEREALEKKRAEMRARLLGEGRKPKGGKGTQRSAASASAKEIGIEEAKDVSQEERDLTALIMSDKRKKSTAPTLTPPQEIQTPNLPEGLTQEAIFEVINQNQRAMSLCISQSMKAGEKLSGKMEVEMQIAATGTVRSATISTPRFSNSTIGKCTVKTVKRWKFPRFNGQPVTVIFPYVLSASF